MNFRRSMLYAVVVTATAMGGVAVTSPAWAAPAHGQGCHLTAKKPQNHGRGYLKGTGLRSDCADQVTYFWVRVYRDIKMWPDAERAVKGTQYVQDSELTAIGACGDPGDHYTHTSTATGLDGDSLESERKHLC